MCRIDRTRYAYNHLPPFHPPNYRRLTLAKEAVQEDLSIELSTNPLTKLKGCQDAGRRRLRCAGSLEELDTTEKKGEGFCEDYEAQIEQEGGFSSGEYAKD